MISRYTNPEMGQIWSDQNKFQKWLDVEIAACEANAKLGLIPADSVPVIKQKAKFDIARISEIEKTTNHDIIAFTNNLAENIGPESRFVHFGLTSSDVVDTALCLLLKDSATLLLKDLDQVIESVRKRAIEHKDTAMIGRTHGIHAEPMTFGAKLLLWYLELLHDKERLEKAKRIISVGKVSGAVGVFANIDPQIEALVCASLGLEPAPISTQILQRDRHAEFMTTLAIIAASLEKFSTEIRNLQRTDLNEVEEFFGKGQKGSSAMPHKKNPITCERITGLARVMRGYALTALENVALWHERDISHSGAERIIFSDACILLDYMLGLFKKVVDGLVVNEKNMMRNLEKTGGLIYSGRVLLRLVDAGYSREDAYKIVQENAMESRQKEVNFKDLLTKDKRVTDKLSGKQLEEIFDVKNYLLNIDHLYKRVLG
ncbi:MAG: adenylosuccinate lyase [Candidatus Margulisiibacteriota bacterium]